jgi:adenylate kinase family enzyme
MNPLTAVFFGISGSGKGTQADLLERFLTDKGGGAGAVRAEMGHLLREFFKTETPLAKRAQEIVNGGGLLPSFMPIFMLTAHLNPSFKGTEHLILDGVCRRPVQSELVDEIARFYGRDNLQGIVLELTPEVARSRLASRGRVDDASEEAMQKRFAWFKEQVVPAIDALEKCGWKIHRINGDADIQAIHKEILTKLGLV